MAFPNTPLTEAINTVGNTNRLAKAINRRQSTVWEWAVRGWPSPDACPAIEAATNGKITVAQLLAPAMTKRRTTKKRARVS
jgi:DNA-binding transcriptional regulator YdaS (Cro superfamily)